MFGDNYLSSLATIIFPQKRRWWGGPAERSAPERSAGERSVAGPPHHRRPRRLHVQGNPHWKGLFPHLNEIGVEVVVTKNLPKVEEVFQQYLRARKKARSTDKIKLTAKQAAVEKTFPAVAKWVQGRGHIEIGNLEMTGFVVRAVDDGGLVFEEDKASTLAVAMVVLETWLAEWFENQGIDVD